MTRHAQQERHAICDTFLRVGADAPTLDDPWLAKDLAAHLVIRDSRPDLAVGMFLPPLRGRLDSAQRELASGSWPALVDRVRQGPPIFAPTRLAPVDEAVNLVELFIHHEDVLRGAPGFERRTLDPGLEKALWGTLRRGGKLMYRGSAVGVVLVADRYGRYAAKGPGELGTVVLRGRPGELMLLGSGRGRVADVEIDGPPEAVAEIRRSRFGG